MGCKKCCVSCASCCCLIPMSAIAFNYMGLDAAVSGGLITNMGGAFNIIGEMLGSPFIGFLLSGFAGFFSIIIFPLHWLLFFRPDEPLFALALLLPWILSGFITGWIFAKNTKEGFLLPIYSGIIIIIIVGGIIGLINNALYGLLDGIFNGLAGVPGGGVGAVGTIILAVLEGSLVGGLFGALAGAIRYDPKAGTYSPKQKKTPQKTYNAFGAPPTGPPSSPPTDIFDSENTDTDLPFQ